MVRVYLDYYKSMRENEANEIFADLIIRREFLVNQVHTVLMVWKGKQSKPCYHYRQNSVEAMEKKILELKADAKRRLDDAEAKKNGKKEALTDYQVQMKAGDILCDSWGYGQTNVEFYKVLEVKGRMATIQELFLSKEYEGHDYGHCTPSETPNGDPVKKRIVTRYYHPNKYSSGNESKVSEYIKINDCVTLDLWDGRPMYFSEYY